MTGTFHQRSYSERLDVIRGWLGERDFARLEAAVARDGAARGRTREIEAWILQVILDRIGVGQNVGPDPDPARAGPWCQEFNGPPPRPKGLPRLTAPQRKALEAYAYADSNADGTNQPQYAPGVGPRAVAVLVEMGLLEEHEKPPTQDGVVLQGRRITAEGYAEYARLKAEQIAHEMALVEEP
jgi:hypothetical protein